MSTKYSYEAVAYTEETDSIIDEIVELLQRRTAHISDARIRNGMVAAALATAAHAFDGVAPNHDTVIVPGGVAERLVLCINSWVPK